MPYIPSLGKVASSWHWIDILTLEGLTEIYEHLNQKYTIGP